MLYVSKLVNLTVIPIKLKLSPLNFKKKSGSGQNYEARDGKKAD